MNISFPFLTSSTQYQEVAIGPLARLGQLSKCLFSVILTCGLVFLHSTSRYTVIEWYSEFRTGVKKIQIKKKPDLDILDNKVEEIAKDIKINPVKINVGLTSNKNLESNINNQNNLSIIPVKEQNQKVLSQVPSDLNEEMNAFLKQLQENPSGITDSYKAEDKLKQLWNIGNKITHSDHKTTLFQLAEVISLDYLKNKFNFAEGLKIRLETAKNIGPDEKFLSMGTKLSTADSKLGLRLQHLGTSSIKTHTVLMHKKIYEEDPANPQIWLHAKLEASARENLQLTIDNLKTPAGIEALAKALPPGFCNGVKNMVKSGKEAINYHERLPVKNKKWEGHFSKSKGGYTYGKYGFMKYEGYDVIEFEGVGKVKIGNSPDLRSEYNHLTIELNKNIKDKDAAAKLHIIFAAIGLGSVSSTSRKEDIDRVKIMQLFRAYYPKESYNLRENYLFSHGSIADLRVSLEISFHHMKDAFKNYFDSNVMNQQEVFPGQKVWSVKGLADYLKNVYEAKGLMASIYNLDFNEALSPLISMLKTGPMSTVDRFMLGISSGGASQDQDIGTGGADSIFSRLIVNGMDKNPWAYSLQGPIFLLYDLDLIERVGYCYLGDTYGSKKKEHYANRPSIVELAEALKKQTHNVSNEICISHRIPPQYIRGVMVQNDHQKFKLIAALEKEEIVKIFNGKKFYVIKVTEDDLDESNGDRFKFFKDLEKKGMLEKINDEIYRKIPVDDFIHVGELKDEYWNK